MKCVRFEILLPSFSDLHGSAKMWKNLRFIGHKLTDLSRNHSTMSRCTRPSVSWESSGMTFMQDNAPIHTTRKVKKRLENHDRKTTGWPLHPPDLTVIEHMWFKLKEVFYQMCLDIEETDESKENGFSDFTGTRCEKKKPLTCKRDYPSIS